MNTLLRILTGLTLVTMIGCARGPLSPQGASAPVVTTLEVYEVTDTTAALRGFVNPLGREASARFEYGPGFSISTDLLSLAPSSSPQAVIAGLAGLQCGTTYPFRATASNGFGQSAGSSRSFTTLACQ